MLNLYEYDKANNQYLRISEDGLFTRPIQTNHDGANGSIVEKQLFLKNEDAAFYFSNIRLRAVPESKVKVGDINFPEAYIGYKIIFKDSQPTKNEWLAVSSGAEAFLSNIGSTNLGDDSYKSVWIQVSIPSGTRVGALTDISLSLEAESSPVGA